MKVRYSSLLLWLGVVFLIPMSYVVGLRDPSVASDTLNYISIYNGIYSGDYGDYELGFLIFGGIFAYLGLEYYYFFSGVFLFVCSFFAISYGVYAAGSDASERTNPLGFVLLIAFLLLSNWFFAATNNALRQGMSLVVLYAALGFLVNKKYFLSFILYALSVSFHYSTILMAPFLVLFMRDISLKYYVVLFFVLAIMYYLGWNEKIIEVASSITGFPLHLTLKEYATGTANEKWVGFDIRFVGYTIFWLCLFLLLLRARVVEDCVQTRSVIKVYAVLSCFYFFYGFGAFSNRFGFVAWLFLPIAQSIFAYFSRFDWASKLLMTTLFLVSGFAYYGEWYV